MVITEKKVSQGWALISTQSKHQLSIATTLLAMQFNSLIWVQEQVIPGILKLARQMEPKTLV